MHNQTRSRAFGGCLLHRSLAAAHGSITSRAFAAGGELLVKSGEEVSEHFDYRPASIVSVRVVRTQVPDAPQREHIADCGGRAAGLGRSEDRGLDAQGSARHSCQGFDAVEDGSR